MRFCLNTDCLGYMPFEEMLDTVAALGYESIEIACGNWSKAPHIDLDAMLASEETRKNYMDAIAKRGLVLEVLNCSGNQLAPNEEGKQHQEVVEKTFKLAGLLGIKKIVMMSGCPGGSAEDHTPNWIVTSWPPITTRILNWQWEEVLIPYWKKTVELAKANGIDKIALENHGCQMGDGVFEPLRTAGNAGHGTSARLWRRDAGKIEGQPLSPYRRAVRRGLLRRRRDRAGHGL